jgi:predicted RNA-binding protein YlxR (DUF448 family)
MSATPTPGAVAGTTKTAKKTKRGPRPKHVPQRTCIACRTSAPKRSFVRVVRTPAGEVVVDPTGKKSGRGASICGTRACWEKALAGTLLDRALRVQVRDADRAALRAYLATLPAEDAGGDEQAERQPSAGGAAGDER